MVLDINTRQQKSPSRPAREALVEESPRCNKMPIPFVLLPNRTGCARLTKRQISEMIAPFDHAFCATQWRVWIRRLGPLGPVLHSPDSKGGAKC